MAADDLPPDPASDLRGALGDLGRRIDAAKVEAGTRGEAPPPRRFPMAWVAVALLVALIGGGLILSSGDDGGEELAAGGGATSTTLPASTTAATTGGTTAEEAGNTGGGTDTTATPQPTTTEAPTTTAATAPTTTEAPTTTTTAPTTTTRPATTTTPTTAPPTTVPSTTAPPSTAPPSVDDGTDQTVSPPPAPPLSEVTVVQGDNFWTIAEQQVGSQLGRAPTTAETTTYWAQLLQLNDDRLVQAGNPNLIHPGQVLVLPGPG